MGEVPRKVTESAVSVQRQSHSWSLIAYSLRTSQVSTMARAQPTGPTKTERAVLSNASKALLADCSSLQLTQLCMSSSTS